VEYPHFLTYDFELNEWSAEKESESNLPLTQHHNRFIDPDTGQLILFGGYGNHTYNSNVLTHPLTGGKWSVDSLLPEISPRYLSAIGYYGNEKFLLMGGFGSPSGRQEDSPINLYDLYEVDYKNKKVKKLADLPKGEVPHTMGASLVIDTVSRKVYTLAYNNEEFQSMIYLLSVDLNTMAQTVLGEPFPYRFLDRESFCDLFLSPSEKKLYTVVLQGGVEGVYDVEFYSLRYAPLQVSDVIQKGEEKNNLPLIIALAGIVLLLLFGGFVYKQKRKNVTKPDQPDSLKPASEATLTDTTIVQEKPASTIFLLGGFRVFNKQAEDITGNFSLIKKQLFVFFLLNSTGDGKGVTTNKLDETFWAEMDKTKAANNRNVNIRNLRILLKTVGKIDIVHENGYWRLILGKDVTCDYYNAIDLIKRLNQKNSYSNEILNQLLDCTSKGLLLPNISTEWTDDYKGAFSNHLIDLLVKISTQEEIRTDPLFRLHIANVILIHDNLNEEAVRTKCRILYKQGKKGLSKQTFDLFCTSYLNILNEKPAFNYDDFVKNL
jgi:LPXTG-motif cell wall-anchored protein